MDLQAEDGAAAAVAVVASAGGVEALTRFVKGLPAGFPAAVLVVLHIPESGPSVLPAILARAGSLPVAHGEDGMALRPGRIVVAPPGRHLRVSGDMVMLDRGPRENGHRPSADALLRSVAQAFGVRSAGVVLSGTMDDGAAGLRAVRMAGGLTVVQEPSDAAFPGMPTAAIAVTDPDVICPVDAMATQLCSWLSVLSPAADLPRPVDFASENRMPDMNDLSPFTCPECGGSLWLEDGDGVERYRCRVGHGFSPRGLLVGKQDAIETALWAAIVALEERADLSRRLMRRLEKDSNPTRVQRYRHDIEHAGQQIEVLRDLISDLIEHGATTPTDTEKDDTDTA